MTFLNDPQKSAHESARFFLIGPTPPPIGGVSVFVYRYSKLLASQSEKVELIDWFKTGLIQKIDLLIRIMFEPKKILFHVNGFYFYLIIAIILRPFPKYSIFYDHSYREIADFRGIKRFLFSKFIKSIDEVWLVGDHLRANYIQNGYTLPSNTHMKHAFIPPPLEDEEKIWKTYDDETLQFINQRSPLLVANGFSNTHYQDIDLYGIDLCIELTAKLKNDMGNIGFLFALAKIEDTAYFSKLDQRINELGIRNNFHFLTGQRELWPIFKKADLMIRPTCTDGYPISIAESLFFGCSPIASDVCLRPEGTTIFKNRDLDDLVFQSNRVLKLIISGKKTNL